MLDSSLLRLLFQSLLIGHAASISCRFYISPDTPARLDVNEGMMSVGSVSHGINGSQNCVDGFQQCFVVWTFVPDQDDNSKLLLQGCWKGNSKECASNRCVANSDMNSEYLANNRFCCCSSSFCNENYTYEYVAKVVPQVEVVVVDHVESDDMVFTVAIIASFIILSVVGVVYLSYRVCSWSKLMFNYFATSPTDKMPLTTESGLEIGGNKSGGSPLLASITLKHPLYSGRYSTVWLADMKSDNSTVALKLYNDGFQRYGINEIRILALPFMKHDCLIECLASSALTECSNKSDLWLMTPYMPRGSLISFLKNSTLSWEAMCRMASSVVQGVAYLHAEIKTNEFCKPAIAHRDLNSRNILVKHDGTCVLCDLAFAVMLENSNNCGDRRDATLAEVGTVRYMAPELLEGAANLRDPETTLKQLDVYALGLVLWEIVSRCVDIHLLEGNSVPAYELPYARDVSTTPTLEEMQRVVCKNKKRPSFPAVLYLPKAGPLHAIREVIEDCWDQDSDARITSLCASERLLELQAVLRTDNLAALQGYVMERDSSAIGNVAAGVGVPYLTMNFGDSTTDTTRTDTSGFVSVGLGSSDRGRSCTSSLGYQTNRSDSSAAVPLAHSRDGNDINSDTAAVDSGINYTISTVENQSRVPSLAEVDNGTVWNNCRSLAKDHLYPLLLMKSAKQASSMVVNEDLSSSVVDSVMDNSLSTNVV